MDWYRDTMDHWHTSPAALHKFGMLIGTLLLALGGYWCWRHHAGAVELLSAGSLLLFAGLLYPRLLRPVYFCWMTLGDAMGYVMTRALLTLVFIIVVTPLAMITRLTGKDQLGLKIRRDSADSYWRPRETTNSTPEEYERQY